MNKIIRFLGVAHGLLLVFLLLMCADLVDPYSAVSSDISRVKQEQDIDKLKASAIHYIEVTRQLLSICRVVLFVVMTTTVATAAILLFAPKPKFPEGSANELLK